MDRKQGFYEKYIKRILDVILAGVALIILSPLLLVLTIVGAVMMKGNPFFTQLRPGKDEKIFKLVKFCSMTNARDEHKNLLPDEERLTKYGKFLRSTSLDELPELWNILKGDLSIVGPRPLLIRDMTCMTSEQRKRHSVRQGLTGLAQVSGRNNITWEEKFEYDIKYINNITFLNDLIIVFKTAEKVFKREDVVRDGTASDMDLGDWLLNKEIITVEEYNSKLEEAEKIIRLWGMSV